MKRSEKHILKFSGLKDGLHEFSYSIKDDFFKSFNYNEFNSGHFKIKIQLIKKPTILELKFSSSAKFCFEIGEYSACILKGQSINISIKNSFLKYMIPITVWV